MTPCHFETNSDQMLSKSLPGLSLDKAAQMMRGYANVLRDRVESKVWVGVRTFQIRECHSNPKAHSRYRRLAHQRLNHIRCLHATYPGEGRRNFRAPSRVAPHPNGEFCTTTLKVGRRCSTAQLINSGLLRTPLTTFCTLDVTGVVYNEP